MQRVDGKIEQMLETYKLMDELQRRKDEIGPEKRRQFLAQKYFPTEDEEEEQNLKGNDEDDGRRWGHMESAEGLEDIIKDDDSDSVYEN